MAGEEYNWLDWIPMATFNTAGLTGTFQALNGTGFGDDIKALKIVNDSDVDVTLSKDSVEVNDIILAGQTFIYDLQANHACHSSYSSGTKYGRKGQVLYGRGSAGTGNVYIVGIR